MRIALYFYLGAVAIYLLSQIFRGSPQSLGTWNAIILLIMTLMVTLTTFLWKTK